MSRLLVCVIRPLAALSFVHGAVVAAGAAELEVVKHERGVTVNADGKLFTEYLIAGGPKPILWPIIGPTGVPMSRAFPMRKIEGEKQDHPHQRSFWFTHGNVNGIDFWSENDPHGSIVHREFSEVASHGDTAVISTRNDWLAPDGKKQLEDQRTLTFRDADGRRTIDFDITLLAGDAPVTFGDTKEGTMGIRVPTVMDVDSGQGGRIVNEKGQTDHDAWGKPAAWVDYHGPVGGQVVGVAILNHPSSFRYPTTWHVRTYGLFAANPFGWRDFQGSDQVDGSHTIAKGDSIHLRYRFVFHQGDEKTARIADAFAGYAKEQKP
ncbi:MAG TPA: PmoA family protein [Pirellulales bacterium]|nr:PmoA family protein [Pirellulales bacterium]